MAESEIITPETETITTEIIVDPESGAGELVVVDMDNDFVAEEGVVVDASGGKIIANILVSECGFCK